ncbi:hypothetical protein K469DRAFT_321442 [Zopfia rhizophila CBS 207.26]|uniref:Uncharacterized protein n=1 Tax=Zopfia rhizophila CBS 207.26 TaxID=1314779 RepID=A0A6A6DLC7_9PEZI|nr:hypothetical protein K469DRAFT_321442 [Zopfia rhizophila CBS 207.26]
MSKILLKRGDPSKKLSITDRRGDIPFRIAADKRFPELALLLLNAGFDLAVKDNFNLTPIDLTAKAWMNCSPYTLPNRDVVAIVLALAERVPDVARQPFLINADIGTGVKTPICSVYKYLRDLEDEHWWTPMALARQLKRPYKIEPLFDGEVEQPPKAMGLRPTKLDENGTLE